MLKYIFVFRKFIKKIIKSRLYFVSMFCKYVLQRRQGHNFGFHSFLKLLIDSLFFKLFGRLSHIFGPKNLMLSRP